MITADIDTTGLHNRLNELHDALIGAGRPGDAATVVEDEAKRFLVQVNRYTPPKNKAQGEAAVEKDLRKIFTPVNEDFLNTVGSEHGVSAVDAWIFSEKRQANINLKWSRIDPSGAGMADFHLKNRNARGRTNRLNPKANGSKIWSAAYIVSFEDFKNYAKKIKERVGRRRAAWGVSYAKLGGAFAGWIGRHVGAGAKGQCVANLSNTTRPGVEMVNFAPGIMDDQRIVQSALRARERAIGKRIRLMISGYAKDVAQGIRITRKERRAAAETLS